MELTSTPDNPKPEGVVCTRVVTSDGIALRAMSARVANSRGTVVILGGRADFMERYFETARDLMDMGYCVASVDLRGQGGSQRLTRNPMQGYIRNFGQYEEDVRSLMTQVVLPDCPPPYYAIGHSTGGNVILSTIRSRSWFRKCVLVAPLIDLNYVSWPLPVAWTLTLVMTSLGLGSVFLPGQRKAPMGRNDFIGNPLTSDQRRWNRDCAVPETTPELRVGGPTFRWLWAAMGSIKTLKAMKSKTKLRCPVLVVMAGQESVVNNEATREFAQRVPGVSLTMIPEAKHEILLEKDAIRQQFFAAFEAFLAEPA
jgi:lysophospholipase